MASTGRPAFRLQLTLTSATLLVGLPTVAAMLATAFIAARTFESVDREAQRLYDTHTELVFDGMRQVRALERLQRAGRPLLSIDDAQARQSMREELGSIAEDGVLQGHQETRTAVADALALLDRCLAQPLRVAAVRARCLAQWQPLEQALVDRMEALSATTATSAAEQVDAILVVTERARRWAQISLATLIGAVVLQTAALVLFIYVPLGRVTRMLRAARRGEPVQSQQPLLREMRWLDTVALELSDTLQELRGARNDLELAANTDLLTGLANRRRFAQVGVEELDRARRTRSPLSVVCLDIDHFKRINDRYGHEGGDIALRALAVYLRAAVRAIDTPARLGGEEFAISMPLADTESTAMVAERLRQGLCELQVSMPNGEALAMSASFGVAQAHTDDANLEDALRRADSALYRAKESGRNRVEVDGASRG